MIVKFIDFCKKEPQLLRNCGYIAAGLILLWSVFFVHHHESHFSLESFPGFWTLFTLFSCLVLVVFAWVYGKTGIQQEEDYYDK